MKRKEMDKFIAHCDMHFRQGDCTVLHAADRVQPHIDVLLYKPNDAYPYWKMVTMGASDYQMPPIANTFGNRNEYMMVIDPAEDMQDKEVAGWYYNKLLEIALYPYHRQAHLTYGHSVEWGEEKDSDMVAAYLELPQLMADPAFLRCKLGFRKQVICLQVVLLTRGEMGRLLKNGSEQFSYYLYPETGEKAHFLCEKNRSNRF